MNQLNYPWKVKPVPKEEIDEIDEHRSGGLSDDHVRVGPHGYYYPSGFIKTGPEIYNFRFRPTDVIVTSFPKSGTTWTQELVWLIGNDLDYERAAQVKLAVRFPFIEYSMFFDNTIAEQWMTDNWPNHTKKSQTMCELLMAPDISVLADISSPRFFKTHFAFSLLPPKLLDIVKIVYVARDPRDVAVSYYHHSRLFKTAGFHGDFKTYWKFFIEGRVYWGPYFPNVLEAWEKRNHPNMLFLFYEELSKDLPGVVRRVAQFLEKPITEEQVHKLCNHLHIDNFRHNKTVNNESHREIGVINQNGSFVRKGKTGGWRAYFDEEMTREAERWIEDNLRGTDLSYPTEKPQND